MRQLLWLVLIGAALPAAHASKIELSTVPAREGVEVIIYRDVDLTLVREQRMIRFAEGPNEVAFSWADTNIDPTSVRVRIAGDGEGYALTETTYPPEQPNTLVWHITAPRGGQAPLEVTYFTSGLTWSASYTLILSYDETEAELAADFSIGNYSGETYENAKVALLTGGVRLVEEVVALDATADHDRWAVPTEAAEGAPGSPDDAVTGAVELNTLMLGSGVGRMAFGEEIAIAAATVSEHERYDLDTDLALLDGWVTRLRFADSATVAPEVLARLRLFQETTATRIVKITNNEENGLGSASLPAGPVSVFKRAPSGRLIYIGESTLPYAAVGQEVEFKAGALPDIVSKPKLAATRKRDITFSEQNGLVTGKVVEFDYKVTVRNRDAIRRGLELIQARPGVPNVFIGEELARREAGQVRWPFALEAGQGAELNYSFHEYHGIAVNDMPQEEGSE